jgi:hypothetical protein
MRPPLLTEVPNIWKVDGSFRDVYVVGTTLEDWKRFIAFAVSYPCSYEYDGMIASMPEIEEILNNPDHTHLLSMNVGAALLNCHFFVLNEIEIDIDPKEVKGPLEHDGVLAFAAGLARAVGKPIIITPENEMETPIV